MDALSSHETGASPTLRAKSITTGDTGRHRGRDSVLRPDYGGDGVFGGAGVAGRDEPVRVFEEEFVAESFSGAGKLNHISFKIVTGIIVAGVRDRSLGSGATPS